MRNLLRELKNTILLTANPTSPRGRGICDAEMLKNPSNWSIGIHRYEVQVGDDFLMLLQGDGRRGIIAMGKVTKIHGEDAFSLQPKKRGFFIGIKPIHWVDPFKQPNKILDIGELINRWPITWNDQPWIPYRSGNFVREPEASEIKAAFAERARNGGGS
jgi:hypothetical protein